MRRKVIGIPGYKQQSSDGFGVGNEYLEYASKYGDVRIIMPYEEVADVDLLLLAGGMDLNPSSYGAIPSFTTSNQDVFKQFFYDKKLGNYVGKVPIIGICLGMQQLGAFFGSKLTQDLPFHKQSPVNWDKGHKAVMLPAYGTRPEVIEINSHHHQGFLVKDLSPELKTIIVGGNEEYGIEPKVADMNSPYNIVEGFIHTELSIAGFQFHPERGFHQPVEPIMKRFLDL